MTKYVSITTVSSFRIRYMIPVPEGVDPNSLVGDLPENEFSQEHLGENIKTIDFIDEEEMLRLFDEENAYLSSWTTEQKVKFVNDL